MSTALLFSTSLIFAADELKYISYRQILAIDDGLHLPSDVAVDGQERIYVLDGTACTVHVYDPRGGPLFTLGDASVLNQPLGLDVTAEGDVLVADSGNHRLVLFPADRSSPRFLELPAMTGGKPADPTDAAFGARKGIFHAVDNDNHRIVTMDSKGTILWTSGTMGRNEQEFRFPFLMDLDGDGNLYVVEVINTRVQVLSPDGAHLRFIGEWGIEPGQFFRPKGIAVSSNSDEVFVSDSYLGIIQEFSRSGQFIGVVADHAGQPIQFTTPVGLTVFGDRLFVIEMFNNRLVVLEKLVP